MFIITILINILKWLRLLQILIWIFQIGSITLDKITLCCVRRYLNLFYNVLAVLIQASNLQGSRRKKGFVILPDITVWPRGLDQFWHDYWKWPNPGIWWLLLDIYLGKGSSSTIGQAIKRGGGIQPRPYRKKTFF